MTDYDTEFHKCLDKSKAIQTKLKKRSENMSSNLPNKNLDDSIKQSLEEFESIINQLKKITVSQSISNQEMTRRKDNTKKMEDNFLQFKKQMEINQININNSSILNKGGILLDDSILNAGNENNDQSKGVDMKKNFLTKQEFIEYKEKKFEEGDKYLEELSGKTKIIKQTGLMITDILDKQKPLLEKMDVDLTRINDKAKRTENKLANYLEKSSNTCLMYAIVIEFIILLLFFVM